jgi:hypothetical protein
MFSRSFKVFGALFLAVLVGVWAFAILGLSGPEEVLREAQAKFDRGEYARTRDLLEGIENAASIQKDRSKLARLLRMRYAANSQLQNSAGALLDLERLLRMPGQDDPLLRLDQIRLLASVDQGERALQLARKFLQELPSEGAAPNQERALELAGEACQTTYRDELANVVGVIERDLGTGKWPRARTALLAYLYRPDGDPEVQQGIENLRLSYSTQSALVASWPTLLRRLSALRARVQEGLSYYQRSLEAGGVPVAAMRAFTLSLDQSQRTDDLLVLCESYRQRFQHKYVFEAGATAAWAQVRAGQYQGAIATARRWLPPNTILEGIEKGQIDAAVGVADLLLARCVAAWRLGDRPALEQIGADLRTFASVNVKFSLISNLTYGVLASMRGDWKNAENSLRGASYQLLRSPVAVEQQDLLPELVPLRIKTLRELGNRDNDVLAVLGEWAKARPADLRPLLTQADFQLGRGQPAAALAALDEAARFAPNDVDVFRLRLQASTSMARDSGQDGEGLYLQCLKRAALFPEVQNPIGYLLCAEAALGHGAAPIARESANYAIDKFPSAREPRLLKARAELLGARPAEAARILLQLLDEFPTDEQIAALALQAHREANLPQNGVLATAMRNCPPSPLLARELLRSALADDRNDLASFLPPSPAALVGAAPEFVILTAEALAREGRSSQAEPLLVSLAPTAQSLDMPLRGELATALVATWIALASTQPDDALLPIVERNLMQFALATAAATPALLQAARDLETTHPKTAYALCSTAFAAADPEQRHGSDLLLAGRLASKLGRLPLAIDHFTAAITFPDGRAAAEPLARLCLANGHSERARQAYALVVAPTDGALALWAGNAASSKQLVAAALQRDGADLLAHVVLACHEQPSLAADLVLPGATERQAVLELASLLDLPELGAQALPLAQLLATAEPQSTTAQLLLARALLRTNQPVLAAAVHARVFAAPSKSPTFWRELALAASSPGYVLPAAMSDALAIAAVAKQVADSPVCVAFSLQRTAEVYVKAGKQPLADRLYASMWTTYPAQTHPQLEDAEGLAGRGLLLDAWWILDKVRPTLVGRQRRQCIERMFALASQIVAKDPGPTGLLCLTARRFLDEEGPQGCVLHFLLAHGTAFPRCKLDESETRTWLLRHLDVAARGQDLGPWLDRTVARLLRDLGTTETLAAIESAVAAHPTSLALWRHRAQLMAATQRGAEGIGDLRAVLRHASSPPEQRAFLTLAATEFELRPDDTRQLQALPAQLLATPAGMFTRGLIALRNGDAAAALPLLKVCAPQADGMHLMALALAQLQSPAPDALAQASATLQRLAADYKSSSLARYAGSFARQLSPR